MKAYKATIAYSTGNGRYVRCSVRATGHNVQAARSAVHADYPEKTFAVLSMVREPEQDWRIEYANIWEPLWRAAVFNAPKPRNRRMAKSYALRLCLGFRNHQTLSVAISRIPRSDRQKRLLRAMGGPNGRIFMKLQLLRLKRADEFDWGDKM